MGLATNFCQTIDVDSERLSLEQIEKNIIKKYRKELWSKFTKAIRDFELIQEGDRVAVAISGGKDSVLMAKLFQVFHKYSDIKFDVEYIVMDPGYHKDIRKLLEENCEYLQIPIKIFDTDVFEVADKISSDYPCYMCAKMRRGALYNIATSLNCNKLSLGHHYDDVIETVMLNVLYAGSYKTMMPKVRSAHFENIELIRPMYYIREDSVIKYTKNAGLNMLNCACMVAAKKTGSKRYEIKNLIQEMKKTNPLVEKSIFSSTKNVYMDCVLGYNNNGKKFSFLEEY
ncbi:tRNA 2-thiocytidine biosynthesis protein TtcA [Criibacterium bergeronii]|uniref:tRNA 2-thiocytidine biosynthesis protein TtcA n=1 Tax=Criibacterium bergeronii TaxID=1871336 RepID=A0A552VC33_9FIRM|nr:ATP-binding protein [Criibacterium bergeronii]TRW27989.1 tRNA 2-thiocytidine biosynthesis protein TtcA [Criibacterium bergeronii]